ncbi:MAG: SDR family oxidoreductase [Desulfobacterales bacterium]|nr:MAG: SDR family oxidoreductase [Desulfobacterales bacterium]
MKLSVMELFDLSGRITVITGGGGELCGTMAEALAGLGVKVAILDINLDQARHRERVIRAAGGTARAFRCDLLNAAELQERLQEITALWEAPDILINGAGGNDPRGSTTKEFLELADVDAPDIKGFLDLEFEGFQSVFNVNFMGTFLPTQVFARGMLRKKKGTVLNISSVSALTPLTKVGAYSAAKAAVSSFTHWLAVHLAPVGIRVNAIAPGFFMTEQLKFLHIDPQSGDLTLRAREVVAHTPMGRYGEPEELLGTVVWLLSDASRFVTGSVVVVDGGFSSLSI